MQANENQKKQVETEPGEMKIATVSEDFSQQISDLIVAVELKLEVKDKSAAAESLRAAFSTPLSTISKFAGQRIDTKEISNLIVAWEKLALDEAKRTVERANDRKAHDACEHSRMTRVYASFPMLIHLGYLSPSRLLELSHILEKAAQQLSVRSMEDYDYLTNIKVRARLLEALSKVASQRPRTVTEFFDKYLKECEQISATLTKKQLIVS